MKFRNGRYLVAVWIVISIIFFVGKYAIAGTTGKIAGRVTDANTGEPLPGANVLIIGTRMGAASDLDGDYFIINIPPGTYTLQVTYMGYSVQQKLNVIVTIDHTTSVNFELELEVVNLGTVVVSAQRYEVIAPDISNSRTVIASETVAGMPVEDFESLMSNQTSIDFRLGTYNFRGSYGGANQDPVYTYREGIRIRGGSISQTLVLQDGLDVQDELNNSGFTNFNLNAIQSVEVITGGFNAEYGNVRSGLVNVITKEGGLNYHGGINFRGRKPGVKHHAPALYDPNYNLDWQVFGQPESLTGHPDVPPQFDLRQDFQGWQQWANDRDPKNYRDIGRPAPSNPNNLLTPAQWQELWKFRSRMREGELDPHKHWDENWDVHLSGPLFPGWSAVTFFTTYNRKNIWFPIPNSRPNAIDNNFTLKLSSHVTSNLKLTGQGMYNKRVGVALYKNAGVTGFSPASGVWPSRYTVSENETDFYRSRSISEQRTKLLGFTLNHVINSKMFYEVKVNLFNKFWDNKAPRARKTLFDEDRNLIEDNIAFKIDVTDQVNPEYYDPTSAGNLIRDENGRFYYVYDEAPGGFLADALRDEFNRGIGGGNTEFYEGHSKKLIAKTDFSAQVNKYNLVKLGFEYNHLDLLQFESQWKPGRNRRWFFARKPQRFAAYIQDKLEFKGMIVNAGIRLDWGNSGGVSYDKDPFSEYLSNQNIREVMGWSYPDNIGRPQDLRDPFPDVPRNKTKSRFAISPRFGISHPITESSKLYFNFGYFHQEPTNKQLYMFYVRDANDLYRMGNPNLDYEQEIAYELGFDKSLFDTYRIHVAGFYKDQSNLVKAFKYIDNTGRVNYRTFNNDGYGETTGLEVRFEKLTGRFITGNISYDYFSSSFGETGVRILKQGEEEGGVRAAELTESSRFLEKPAPSLRINVNLHTPSDWGPKWGSFFPMGDWSLDILHTWDSGRWFTWVFKEDSQYEDYVESNVQWRDHVNTDLKLSKRFSFYGLKYRFYMQINNLFNRKELYADESLWDTDDAFDEYMESLRTPQRKDVLDGEGNVITKRNGDDRPGDFPEYDENGNCVDNCHIKLRNFPQLMFLMPREFFFGLEILF